jgi:hypothetical protein
MKRYFASACLAVGLALSANSLALAQSSPATTLTPAQAKSLASGIIQGANCPVLRALDGMDKDQAVAAARAIAIAGQQISPGSMGVVTFDGDPGNLLLSLNFINQKTRTQNKVVLYVLFSNAHPVVDGTNSACSY